MATRERLQVTINCHLHKLKTEMSTQSSLHCNHIFFSLQHAHRCSPAKQFFSCTSSLRTIKVAVTVVRTWKCECSCKLQPLRRKWRLGAQWLPPFPAKCPTLHLVLDLRRQNSEKEAWPRALNLSNQAVCYSYKNIRNGNNRIVSHPLACCFLLQLGLLSRAWPWLLIELVRVLASGVFLFDLCPPPRTWIRQELGLLSSGKNQGSQQLVAACCSPSSLPSCAAVCAGDPSSSTTPAFDRIGFRAVRANVLCAPPPVTDRGRGDGDKDRVMGKRKKGLQVKGKWKLDDKEVKGSAGCEEEGVSRRKEGEEE